MPGHDGIRFHNDQGVYSARRQTAKSHPELSVAAAQARAWLFTLERDLLTWRGGNLPAEAVTADEERTAVGDHREHERNHYFSSYSLAQAQPRFRLLILWADRL